MNSQWKSAIRRTAATMQLALALGVASLILASTSVAAGPPHGLTGFHKGLPPSVPVPAWAKSQSVHFMPWATAVHGKHEQKFPPRGSTEAAESAVLGTPPLLYHGGAGVQHNPHVYAIFWGSNWEKEPGLATREEVMAMYEGLSGSELQGVLTQYFDSIGRISPTVAVTSYIDNREPAPSEMIPSRVEEEVAYAIEKNGWNHNFDNQFVVLTAPGTTYKVYEQNCAYHGFRVVDSTKIAVSRAFVPYEGDEPFAEHCLASHGGDPADATSAAASHEYAESATDPNPNKETWGSADGWEIADLCYTYQEEVSGGGVVSLLWDNYKDECTAKDPNPAFVWSLSEPATAVGPHEATLHSKVYPEALETEYFFEYGLTSAYGTKTPASFIKAPAAIDTSELVSKTITGLELEKTYHYRSVVKNSTGTFYGPEQTLFTSRWSIDDGSQLAEYMSDISCTSSVSCVAAGYKATKGGYIAPAALQWDGSKWTAMSAPPAAGAEESELRSISCAPSNYCMATVFAEPLSANPVLEVWDGSKWSLTSPLIPPEAVSPMTRINDVSCTSSTYCLAVGSYSTAGTAPVTKRSALVESWNGSEWTIEKSANAEGQNLSELVGVSCWGVANCLLVGNSKKAYNEGTLQPLVESRSSGKWVVQAAPAAPGGTGKLTGVSCRNGSFCMVLGRDGTEAGFTSSWNGFSWKEQSSGQEKGLHDISCGAMNSCDMVGGITDYGSSMVGYHWNGSVWLVEKLAFPQGTTTALIHGISCLSDGVCKAAGAQGSHELLETITSWWNYPTYSFSSGSNGTGSGQFTNPWGVAADPSGNVWVTDTGNNRVQKLNSKGEYQCQIGSKGAGNGQFSGPFGIAADSSGNAWVTDIGNNRIQEINSECKYVTQVGKAGTGNGQFYSPSGVTVDPSGNVWVLDSGNSRIQKFNSKGEYLTQCGSYGSGNGQLGEELDGIAADADGNVWVADADNARLEKFSGNCEYLAKITQASSGSPISMSAYGLALDPAGDIWVPSRSLKFIAGLHPEGEYIARVGEPGTGNGQIGDPTSVAFAPDGTLWIVDRSNNRIEKWSAGVPNPVETGRAASIKTNEAKLTATINPEGRGTAYDFEYGTTPSYGSYVPSPSMVSIGSGTSPVAVSPTLSGLKAGTTYYYRLRIFIEGTIPPEYHYGKPRKFTTRDVEANAAPTISQATPFQGVPDTTTNGTWYGEASSYAYQWRRCNGEGKECANISGATASSYTPVEADVGNTLVIRVTATGPTGGTAVAYSAPSGKVTAIGTRSEYTVPAGSGPWGITTGPDSNLWFTNATSSKVGKITTSGTVTEYSLPASSEPRGITAGPDGNLWFTEYATNKIAKITTSGTKTEYSLPANTHPLGIAAGPDGNLWFAEAGTNGKVGKITTSGTITEYSLESGSQPQYITAGPDGNLWFTDVAKSRVDKITTSGTVTTYALPIGSAPRGIVTGPDGKLWFTNTGTSKIGKITTSGTLTEYAAGSAPEFIASGPDGNLWFTSFPEKISRISTSGTVTSYSLPSSPAGPLVAGPDNRMWFPVVTNKIAAFVP